LPLIGPNNLHANSGTAHFEFLGPGAIRMSGTFSGIAAIAGTGQSRYYAGSFYSNSLFSGKRANDVTLLQAQFRSLAEPWADTGTTTGRLMPAV
jgi:hypothetical protein